MAGFGHGRGRYLIEFQGAVFTWLLVKLTDLIERCSHPFVFLRSGQHRHAAGLWVECVVCSRGQAEEYLEDLVRVAPSCRVNFDVAIGERALHQQWLGKSCQPIMITLSPPGDDAVADDRQLHLWNKLCQDRQQSGRFLWWKLVGDKLAGLGRRFRTVPLFHKRLQWRVFLVGRPDKQPVVRIIRDDLNRRVHFGEKFPRFARRADRNRIGDYHRTVRRVLSVGKRLQ